MKSAELIEALRECEYCNVCSIAVDGDCPFGGRDALEVAAADALEAADKRINELTTKCNQLQASVDNYEKLIAELEAQIPKEGEWIWENYCWHCSVCGENPTRGMGYVQEKNELFRVCPNCGAKLGLSSATANNRNWID